MRNLIGYVLLIFYTLPITSAQKFLYGSSSSSSNSTCYYHMHIPKTGGASLRKELSTLFQNGQHGLLVSSEKRAAVALKEVIELRNCAGHVRVLTMVREPTTHVLSQYSHCTGARVYRSHWKDVPPLQVWLSAHDQTHNTTTAKRYTNCRYSPRNLQASYIESVQEELWFLGVMEHFQLSMCLLHYQLLHDMPKECDCNSRKKNTGSNGLRVHHRNHNLKKIAPSSLTDLERNLIHRLTETDTDVYQSAMFEFFQRVHAVESKSGVNISC